MSGYQKFILGMTGAVAVVSCVAMFKGYSLKMLFNSGGGMLKLTPPKIF